MYTLDKYLHRRRHVMRAPVPILVANAARFEEPCGWNVTSVSLVLVKLQNTCILVTLL